MDLTSEEFNTVLYDMLQRLGACDDAMQWVLVHDKKGAEWLWSNCGEPSWMLWLVGRCVPDNEKTAFYYHLASGLERNVSVFNTRPPRALQHASKGSLLDECCLAECWAIDFWAAGPYCTPAIVRKYFDFERIAQAVYDTHVKGLE